MHRRPLIRSVFMLTLVPVALRRHMGRPRLASFYQRAIEANRHTARAVATTPYLQRMHDGSLSPLDYGCLTVQDGPTPARCD